ncbi:hypothetical protein [Brooklawnia sp.]|uniref:hypothetical protein n=1 Tax=Brooklawnia sp. TaxID=2699740 RepID=UPI00311FCD1D
MSDLLHLILRASTDAHLWHDDSLTKEELLEILGVDNGVAFASERLDQAIDVRVVVVFVGPAPGDGEFVLVGPGDHSSLHELGSVI